MKKICIFFIIGIIIVLAAVPLQGLIITEKSNLHFKDESLIDIEQVWFNWGSDSHAITIKGCQDETPLETPEFDKVKGRNNPAAYVKGTRFTIKVKLTSELLTNIVTAPRHK